MEQDDAAVVSEADVRVLARLAGLPLDEQRGATLAAALEADLRVIRRLRSVDAGEIHPAGVTPLPREQSDGR